MHITSPGARALAPTTPAIATSFTPGPYAISDTGYITSTDRDHHYVAQVCHARNGQRHPANEALLAAAPDLHQACTSAERLLTRQKFHATEHTDEGRTLLALRAALAKVEGGAS